MNKIAAVTAAAVLPAGAVTATVASAATAHASIIGPPCNSWQVGQERLDSTKRYIYRCELIPGVGYFWVLVAWNACVPHTPAGPAIAGRAGAPGSIAGLTRPAAPVC